jgi:maltose alpha-D-glucosyltransferase/alpha-amylase
MTTPPLWYKEAIFYEVRIGAFYDSNGDGVGDVRGLTEKLDYIESLGVDTIWLLPHYPSPLRDDGYDIADYLSVHSDLGTLAEFRQFVREAHQRNLRVVTELVLNHVSDQHPWFQRARREPAGKWRDFFVWNDSQDRYRDARIIFKDFEASNWTWDPVAKAYFWHRFYSHQPDLNFDNPAVQRAVLEVVDFWFGMGVDGLRLDAVPYLYEREGTNCENLPETHAFLKKLRAHVDQRFQNRMLLAEANQWPEDAAAYFGNGDECHMAFHFPIMPRLFMALHMEDRFPIVDILEQTPVIPDTAQWALFLRNHDELTLEMVTDEERDYMYRVYAHDAQARINLGIRRRLAPLLGNHRRRIELMNALLLSLPGTPVIYYGDEIGMGDNYYLGDRNGVRTPMQWSPDRNAGFSRANPQRLYLPVIVDPEYHYEAINVEAQENNTSSLLWWMRRIIALRQRYHALGRGTLEFIASRNPKILSFVRRHEDEQILVVANLSRYAQCAELDVARFAGTTPVEVFGITEFPEIGNAPYVLTLGPHGFYWFLLAPRRERVLAGEAVRRLPELEVAGDWSSVWRDDAVEGLTPGLLTFLQAQRWYGGKARKPRGAGVTDTVRLGLADGQATLLFLDVAYADADSETYVLVVAWATGERAAELERGEPQRLIARLTAAAGDARAAGVLYEATADPAVTRVLRDTVLRRRRLRGTQGSVRSGVTVAVAPYRGMDVAGLEPRVARVEQSNTSIGFGDRLILKLLRRTAPGQNPDLEIGRFLTERAAFPHVAPLVGYLEYESNGADPATLAVMHRYVENEGDAWRFTLDELERYFERVAARPREAGPAPVPAANVLSLTTGDPPAELLELVGGYLESVRTIGARTAELHLALASDPTDPAFCPERFSTLYQRGLYQSMRTLARRVLKLLADAQRRVPPNTAATIERVLDAENRILQSFRRVIGRKITAMRIRCHGDYHLGQLLYTGKDFVVIDFEGEPARPLSERRIKRSPLRDVAGMIRSFHYAAHTAHAVTAAAAPRRPDEAAALDAWATFWYRWVASAFLRSYLATAGDAPFLPRTREELDVLLHIYVLEKAVYEVGYELNNRPDWVWLPLRGVLEELEASGAT